MGMLHSNVDRSNVRNVFKLEKARSRRYPLETIINADYTNDLALLPSAPALAEFLLRRLGASSRRY